MKKHKNNQISINEWATPRIDNVKISKKFQFIMQKQIIIDALEDGFSIKDIFNYLTEIKKINFSYETLRRYVNTYIINDKPIKSRLEYGKSNNSNNQTHIPIIAKTEPIPRFRHNSVPRPPEELF